VFLISCSDILKLDDFSGMNEVQLIHPDNDEKVLNHARTAGMDITGGYAYEASQHKNMFGKTVVGYRLIGELTNAPSFRASPFCTSEIRTLSHLRRDVSLTQEMVKLSGGCFSYGKSVEEDAESDREYESMYEENWQVLEQQINLLNQVAKEIRGTAMGANGGMKTFYEYVGGANGKQ
jgi:hypothetical protein